MTRNHAPFKKSWSIQDQSNAKFKEIPTPKEPIQVPELESLKIEHVVATEILVNDPRDTTTFEDKTFEDASKLVQSEPILT
jgi:hypothetical protein